jgi:vacuolar fusion protein MON1
MNTIHSPSITNSSASASWIPVCLPKFNPAGFVNAYISFMQIDGEVDKLNEASSDTDAETPTRDNSHPDNGAASTVVGSERAELHSNREPESGIALICVSGSGEFESVRTWCDIVTKVTSLCLPVRYHNSCLLSAETRK